jgi:hypothetical protein
MSEEHRPVSPRLPQLGYANPAQQYGIIVESRPDTLRITIPKRLFKFLPSVIIELDSARLRFQGVMNEWNEGDSLERPRNAIYEVKFVAHTGKLFIKAHGFEFIECQPHRDPRIVEWIAQQLNDALEKPTPLP